MIKREKISEAVIKRLPRYYHCLKDLEQRGILRVSSNVISGALNVTASQVRQDFSNFGEFGQQGYGYDVENLKMQMARILGLDREYGVVVIGGGNIGRALAGYGGFKAEGFRVLAVFDVAPERCLDPVGVELLQMDRFEEYVSAHGVDMCFIATGADSAQSVAARAVKSGIRAIWNFAPVELYFGEDVAVENINMSESLFMLSFKLLQKNDGGTAAVKRKGKDTN